MRDRAIWRTPHPASNLGIARGCAPRTHWMLLQVNQGVGHTHTIHRMNRVLPLVLGGLVALALLAGQVQGQVAPAAAASGDSTQPARATAPGDSAQGVPARKSPVGAAVLGLIVPGSAHWYAGEGGRGALVAVVYLAGYAVVRGGRTDRVGQVFGVMTIGAVGFSVIDGVRAVKRFNKRRAAEAPPPRELPP